MPNISTLDLIRGKKYTFLSNRSRYYRETKIFQVLLEATYRLKL